MLNIVKTYLIKVIFFVKKSFSLFLYLVSARSNADIEKVRSLKGKYVGKRIFIVCNGPSLRADDLEIIRSNGDISFASNRIDKIFGQTLWRPNFYTILDTTFQYSLKSSMHSTPSAINFFSTESYMATKNVDNAVFLKTNRSSVFLVDPKFSEDISKELCTIGTVTYAMIEMARYMGFKEMYIIGCDNSYGREMKKDGTIVETGRTSYFKGSSDKDNKKAVGAIWQLNIAYEFAEKYSRENGFRIYNATRGGYLEAFERVDFDSLFPKNIVQQND